MEKGLKKQEAKSQYSIVEEKEIYTKACILQI